MTTPALPVGEPQCPRCVLEAAFSFEGEQLPGACIMACNVLRRAPLRFCAAHRPLEVALCGRCGMDVHSYRCARCLEHA